jgi:pimeloyl-ACP methyl ester carboxylesterase
MMAGCSHLPMGEQPDAYRSAVDGWLRRHDAP